MTTQTAAVVTFYHSFLEILYIITPSNTIVNIFNQYYTGYTHFKHKGAKNMIKIKFEYIFPLLLILLDVGAAIIYALQKDYKKSVYWIAAAVLNVTVTF